MDQVQTQFSPQPEVQQQDSLQDVPPKKSSIKTIVVVLLIIIILLLSTVFVFAYFGKFNPFASESTYSEDNFLSNLLVKVSEIETATYGVQIAMNVVPREEEVKALITPEVSEEEIQKYKNDLKRTEDISSIVRALSLFKQSENNKYPQSLAILSQKNIYSGLSINDPKTGQPYSYTITDNGNNYIISTTLESDDAIKWIKKLDRGSSLKVENKTISITKNPTFIYLPAKIPKSFIAQLQDSLNYVSQDFMVNGGLTVYLKTKEGEVKDAKINISGEGSLGDLTYKLNIDGIKKDKNYYFKVNNMPIMFFMDYVKLKDRWISLNTESDSNKQSKQTPQIFDMGEIEGRYLEGQKVFLEFLKKFIIAAENNKLVVFREKPVEEEINGERFTKYDLRMRRESFVPVLKELKQLVEKDVLIYPPTLIMSFYSIFEELVNYYESQEFKDTFDLFNSNTEILFWNNNQGFPSTIQITLKVVPPDTNKGLEGKQLNSVLKLVLTDINKEVEIEEPGDAVSWEEIIKEDNF